MLRLALSGIHFILSFVLTATVTGSLEAVALQCGFVMVSVISSSVILLRVSRGSSLLRSAISSRMVGWRPRVPVLRHWKCVKRGKPSTTGMNYTELAPADTTRPVYLPVR